MDLAIDVRLAAKSTTLNLDSMSFVFIASKPFEGEAVIDRFCRPGIQNQIGQALLIQKGEADRPGDSG